MLFMTAIWEDKISFCKKIQTYNYILRDFKQKTFLADEKDGVFENV